MMEMGRQYVLGAVCLLGIGLPPRSGAKPGRKVPAPASESQGAPHARRALQFTPSIDRYRPDWDPKDLESTKEGLRARAAKKDGHYVEAFRVATHFNQQ